MNQKTVRLIFTILVSAVLITFIFSLIAPAVFAQYTELEYPKIPGGAQPPNEVRGLPNFIKYLFNLGIAVAGLAAFISFVYGGVRYVSSAGNPGTLSEAREQIKASLLGLVLLLGSWLLLTTINPKLVVLQIDKGGGDRQGVLLFAPGVPCTTGADNTQGREEDTHFLRVKNSLSDVTKFSGSERFPSVGNIQFLNSSEQIGINLYSEYGYRPESPIFRSSDQGPIAAGACVPVSKDIGSVEIVWKVPGIYLFAGANCTGDVRAYSGNTASLGDFDNKAQSLKIIPSTTTVSTPYSAEELDGLTPIPPPRSSTIITNKLGVILFQKDGAQNDGAVFLGGDMSYVSQPEARCIPITNACSGSQEPYCVKGANEIVGDVSSLKVFNQYLLTDVPSGSQTTQLAKPPSGDGVTLFGNYDFNEQDPGSRAGEQQIHCGPINATSASGSDLKIGKPLWVNGEDGSNNNRGIGAETLNSGDNISNLQCTKLLKDHQWTSSIRIDGDYIAVLFRSDGRAEVFKAPGDYRLRDNHVGDDSARYLLVIPIKQR